MGKKANTSNAHIAAVQLMQFICFGNAKRQIVISHHYQVKWQQSWSKESTGSFGSWTGLDEITLQPHDAITIGISTTSSDSRLKYYVVTLLHHTLFAGEMYRIGAISTVLPGKQTVARAWYYGLRMIAHYVDLQSMVRVHVLSVKAWQGWVKGRHHETFYDLAELVTWDQRQRIRALSVTQQQIKTMPSTGLSLRNRFKDANRAAKEFALSKQPVAIEQELQEQDQRYGQYAPMAAARIRFLLETQDHFLHGKKATGKEQRQEAREEKKHLYLEIGVTGHERGHQWTSKGRGLQCRNCKKQIHQRMPMAVLKTAKDEACGQRHSPHQRRSTFGVETGLHHQNPRGELGRWSPVHPAGQLHCVPEVQRQGSEELSQRENPAAP